jgi:dienelactone hydrolase
MKRACLRLLLGGWLAGGLVAVEAEPPEQLPATEAFAAGVDLSADALASQLVDGVDRFLLGEIDAAREERRRAWRADHTTREHAQAADAARRERLARILGLRDPRPAFEAPQLLATPERSAVVGRGMGYEILAVRWPAVEGVHGEGLLLVPSGEAVASVVVIPDAELTPEQYVGLSPGVPMQGQLPRLLAERGCRVLMPALIDRHREKRNGRAMLTSREYLYRSAFELGRHIVGYELQKVFAAVDWFQADSGTQPIGVVGFGEGGMLALYAAALDPRIELAGVCGFFGDRDRLWEQPIDRNVFGLLSHFGDAELAAMVLPRKLVIENSRGPERVIPGDGGAPAVLRSPEGVAAELARVRALAAADATTQLIVVGEDGGAVEHGAAVDALADALGAAAASASGEPEIVGLAVDSEDRQRRQIAEIDRFTQRLLATCADTRRDFLPIADQLGQAPHQPLDFTSPAAYERSIEPFREQFATEVIGRFDHELLPPRPRSQLIARADGVATYRLVLDVFPDVMATGLLLLPDDVQPGERRPVVVCQHGLEGRPDDLLAGADKESIYKGMATRLAQRGFITFAPQNLYLYGDRFRTLQRKANPLGKTLFSVIVPQHRQIVGWLATLPQVDPERIAFYGLSYGGKSAMRIPALVDDYCLSICSADFNDWVWKNASTSSPYSYVWTGEYEIFEFDLGSTFNYAEMAALIAPRPFMVERGHFDTVGPDERVALEFAKVRFLYEARLGLPGRAEIEWFVGPHAIHGEGTYAFLHHHLDWPVPASEEPQNRGKPGP